MASCLFDSYNSDQFESDQQPLFLFFVATPLSSDRLPGLFSDIRLEDIWTPILTEGRRKSNNSDQRAEKMSPVCCPLYGGLSQYMLKPESIWSKMDNIDYILLSNHIVQYGQLTQRICSRQGICSIQF